jgi:hypothetical protein
MPRTALIAVALSVVLSTCTGGVALAGLFGPGPWFGRTWAYGNDTGGIIPYSPDIRDVRVYRQLAADYCAQWRRLSHVTSMHRKYGDYVGFVCMDRPGVIH